MKDEIQILLVEDNPGDVRLTREAFREVQSECHFHVVTDGVAATEFLYRRSPYADAPRPDLVLLDLNLPNKDGEALLGEMKADADLRRIPVIVLSSSANDDDITTAYERCANAYLVKPVDPTEFVSLARTIEEFWLSRAELPSA